MCEQRTANNFHNRSNKDIFNENNEKTEYIKTRRLRRPISTVNVKIPLKTRRKECNENQKTIEKPYKKIPFRNLCNVDLDSLFEEQLQKLREINRCEEEECKIKNNSNFYKKDYLEEKKNEEFNKVKVKQFKKVFDKSSSYNHIKNTNSQNRPLSNHKRVKNNLLPTIEAFPPCTKNLFKKRFLSNKNFEEKRITFNKVNPIIRPITTNKTTFHREYGKVPKYLKKMKINAKLIKDLERKKEEKKNYPKGTRLLSDEERMFTLKKLQESKKELENLVTKLPIILDSIGAKNRQQKLYKELDEIDHAINTFSKNKVFVKIDNQ